MKVRAFRRGPAARRPAGRSIPSRRQLRRLLLRAGFRFAPPPRPSFVAMLAARFGAYGTPQIQRAAVHVLPARVRRQLPIIAGAIAAVAATVLAAAFSGWFGRGPDGHTLALAGAVDTTVLMPDGTSIVGRDGLALPDGALVRTGPNGRAAAGDVEIGPELEALVDAGHLRLRTAGDGVAAATALTASSTASTTKPVATSVSSTTSTRPTPTSTRVPPIVKVTLPSVPSTTKGTIKNH